MNLRELIDKIRLTPATDKDKQELQSRLAAAEKKFEQEEKATRITKEFLNKTYDL